MDLTINVDALDKTSSAVESSAVRTALDELQLLTVGNIEPLVLSFCDDTGATPSWVTDASVLLAVGLGDQDVNGTSLYTSTSSFTIVGSTRTGALNLNTSAIRTAIYNKVAGRINKIARMVLEIRKTNVSAGTIETLGLLPIQVATQVLTSSPTDNTIAAGAANDSDGTIIKIMGTVTTHAQMRALVTTGYANPKLFNFLIAGNWEAWTLRTKAGAPEDDDDTLYIVPADFNASTNNVVFVKSTVA